MENKKLTRQSLIDINETKTTGIFVSRPICHVIFNALFDRVTVDVFLTKDYHVQNKSLIKCEFTKWIEEGKEERTRGMVEGVHRSSVVLVLITYECFFVNVRFWLPPSSVVYTRVVLVPSRSPRIFDPQFSVHP